MLRTMRKYTEIHSQKISASFTVTLQELECFIGLQLAWGLLVAKNTPLENLWKKEWEEAFLLMCACG